MRRGHLADYFKGAAAKLLKPVDTTKGKSTQHEVNGSKVLRKLLGDRERKRDDRLDGTFIWLKGEQEAISEEGKLSWYDSRKNKEHRGAEWRLYYQSNAVTDLMQPGDALFIARRTDDRLLFIVVPADSGLELQLCWLFGLPPLRDEFSVTQVEQGGGEIDFAARYILDEIGLEYDEPDSALLDRLLSEFGTSFPTTSAMSALSRRSLPDVSARDDPDNALTLWLEREEQLFRRLERRVVSRRLSEGFVGNEGADVDGFLKFSLSVQNRRKARMGLSLENHLAAVFSDLGIAFARGAVTENKSKPDFLFPGAREYGDEAFPPQALSMLAAKSSCKDRWRQILSEADRIPEKHLLTLEPAISVAQTSEMMARKLQLVLPKSIHRTYRPEQQTWLFTLGDFISMARERARLDHAKG